MNQIYEIVKTGTEISSSVGTAAIVGVCLRNAVLAVGAVNPILGVCAFIGSCGLSTALNFWIANVLDAAIDNGIGRPLGAISDEEWQALLPE